MLKGIINFSHHLLEESVKKGETVIDATCGNDNDTLFLSKLVDANTQVPAFDIQKQANQNAEQLITDHQRGNVSFIIDSHAHASDYVSPEMKSKIGGAIFNLGYLPKSDKSIITQRHSTNTTINTMLKLLKKNSLIAIDVYHEQDGDQE